MKVSKKKVSLNERNWSDEEIEQLITSYESRKYLWDISCVNYMNRGAIDSANNKVEEDLKVYVTAYTGKEIRATCPRLIVVSMFSHPRTHAGDISATM